MNTFLLLVIALAVTGTPGTFPWSITGGPKVGKTTIVASILRILAAKDVWLAAASRIREGRHVPSVE